MNKRVTIILVLVAAIGTTALLLARSQPSMLPSSDLQRESAVSGWPADRAFAWSFKTPKDDSKGYGLSLRVRAKSSTLKAGTNPVFRAKSSAMPASEAEIEYGPGTMMPGGQTGSGQVTVQLVDLSTI